MHGSPLGDDELRQAKKALGWNESRQFFVADDVHDHFLKAKEQGKACESDWQQAFFRYSRSFPEQAEELRGSLSSELPKAWDTGIAELFPDKKAMSTRKAGETVLQHLAQNIPALAGGSADLNPSTLTWIKECGDFQNPELCSDNVQGSVGTCWGYRWQKHPLRGSRACNGRYHHRHGAARRHDPLCIHVPHVFRLHAACNPHCMPVRGPQSLYLHP